MNPPVEPQPRQRRCRVRHQARLDAETHAKLEELARIYHRKLSAILRYIIQWGLGHAEGWIVDQSPVVAVPPVPVLLEPELFRQVQETAAVYHMSIAAWLRKAVRRVTVDDFPAS